MEAKLGGIYELEQLARQSEDRRIVIFDVLAAYIRQHPPPAHRAGATVDPLQIRAPDVQAALTVLGRREIKLGDPRIDLSRVDISGADLSGANLAGAYLYKADLRWADLYNADMRGADLSSADLREVYLDSTKLQGATSYMVGNKSTTKWPLNFDWDKAGVEAVGD